MKTDFQCLQIKERVTLTFPCPTCGNFKRYVGLLSKTHGRNINFSKLRRCQGCSWHSILSGGIIALRWTKPAYVGLGTSTIHANICRNPLCHIKCAIIHSVLAQLTMIPSMYDKSNCGRRSGVMTLFAKRYSINYFMIV